MTAGRADFSGIDTQKLDEAYQQNDLTKVQYEEALDKCTTIISELSSMSFSSVIF